MSKENLKEEILEEIKSLSDLLSERIVENNTIGKVFMSKQATHAFVLYRSRLWDIQNKVKKL